VFYVYIMLVHVIIMMNKIMHCEYCNGDQSSMRFVFGAKRTESARWTRGFERRPPRETRQMRANPQVIVGRAYSTIQHVKYVLEERPINSRSILKSTPKEYRQSVHFLFLGAFDITRHGHHPLVTLAPINAK
jgi:hypothetical protein